MQGLEPPLEGFRMLMKMRRHSGVEIPAVVIEPDGGIAQELLHIGGVLLLQVVEARHDIRHLDAGIVDVVLDFDAAATRIEHADKRVTQNGVAQVPDVGGLVGIDVGMFDNNLARLLSWRFAIRVQDGEGVRGAIEPDVDITIPGDLERRYTVDMTDILHDFARDLTRRTSQPWRKIENRERNLTKRRRLWFFQGRRATFIATQKRHKTIEDSLFNQMKHLFS